MQKRVAQLCTLTKISSEIGFLSVNWAIPEKRWELSTYFFEKKNNWKFWKKQSYSLLLRIFPHGFNGPVFYYITILFSHQLSGPDFVLRKKHGFLCLVASRLKIFMSHEKLQGAQVIRLKRNFAN